MIRVSATPRYYLRVGNEVELADAAWRRGLPVMPKGPTGCGKTRPVEFIADRVGTPLFTVSCHEDMTALITMIDADAPVTTPRR